MRKQPVTIWIIALVIASIFVSTKSALAQCEIVGTIPSGGQDVVCSGVETSGIATTPQADRVTIEEDANITAMSDVVDTLEGDDEVLMKGGSIISPFNLCIDAGPDNDSITIEGGVLEGFLYCVDGGPGNDTISLSNTKISADFISAILADDGDDIITIGNNVELESTNGPNIECNGFSENFDTIIFAIEVPEGLLPFYSSLIEDASPEGDSITINEFTYSWQGCELLVNNLVGIQRNVPTLSEWGLIATAGILGLAGLIVIRRRQTARENNL